MSPNLRQIGVIVAVLAAAIITGTVVNLILRPVAPGTVQVIPPPPTVPDDSAPVGAPPAPAEDGSVPTGCLGSDTRDLVSVLAAQARAPHTTTGAVEVAAALMRSTVRYPLPDAEQTSSLQESIAASGGAFAAGAFSGMQDKWDQIAEDTAAQYGAAELHVSLADGRWHVEDAEPDMAAVTINSALIADDSPINTGYTLTYTMVWEDSRWKLAGTQALWSSSVFRQFATPFSGGC